MLLPGITTQYLVVSFDLNRATLTLMLCTVASSFSPAQKQAPNSETLNAIESKKSASRLPPPVDLSLDDGLTIIAAALDSIAHVHSKRDCSHFVHAIYARAGFDYPYARSSDLYSGIKHFRLVKNPQPGDLVVWRTHVGIIVNPAHHVFFSSLHSGPAIDTYDAPHWKRKGEVRFYRYINLSQEKIGGDRSDK